MWDPARLAQPRFAGLADLVARLVGERDWPAVATLDDCFRTELASVGVRLVEASKTRPARAPDGAIDPASLYEVRIVEHGEIPTRPRNVHDLCNALVWAAFPHTKLALSRALATLQRSRVAGRTGFPPTRTHAHDRLALIDEGAVVYVAGARATSTWIFGHALYEHAYAGDRSVRGAAIDIVLPDHDDLAPLATRAAVDRALAAVDLAHAARRGAGVPVA